LWRIWHYTSLLFAEGNEPVSLTDSQQKLLERWARLSEEQQTVVFALIDIMNIKEFSCMSNNPCRSSFLSIMDSSISCQGTSCHAAILTVWSSQADTDASLVNFEPQATLSVIIGLLA